MSDVEDRFRKKFVAPRGYKVNTKAYLVLEFIESEIRKAKEEERERIKEVVSIEIEAWFAAHDEMEKSFMSEDMIKQIVKRMEE